MVKILVLGSGKVAQPCIEYLSRSPKNEITVGKFVQVHLFDLV